jgi:hypothetical protein
VLDYCVIAPKFINPRYSWSDLQIDKLILRGNWGAALVVGWLQAHKNSEKSHLW